MLFASDVSFLLVLLFTCIVTYLLLSRAKLILPALTAEGTQSHYVCSTHAYTMNNGYASQLCVGQLGNHSVTHHKAPKVHGSLSSYVIWEDFIPQLLTYS